MAFKYSENTSYNGGNLSKDLPLMVKAAQDNLRKRQAQPPVLFRPGKAEAPSTVTPVEQRAGIDPYINSGVSLGSEYAPGTTIADYEKTVGPYSNLRDLTGIPYAANGRYADPATVTKNAQFKTLPAGGQYLVEPSQPGKGVLTERKPLDLQENNLLRQGLDPTLYQIDHTIPLWAGGADTVSNKEILDTMEHAEKTKIQAVAQTLLGSGLISQREALGLASNWREKASRDDIRYPEASSEGIIDINDAKRIAKKWTETPSVTLKSFLKELPAAGERMYSTGAEIANEILGKESNPLTSSIKGFTKGFISMAVPGSSLAMPKLDSYTGGTAGNISQVLGSIAGSLIPFGLAYKAALKGLSLAGVKWAAIELGEDAMKVASKSLVKDLTVKYTEELTTKYAKQLAKEATLKATQARIKKEALELATKEALAVAKKEAFVAGENAVKTGAKATLTQETKPEMLKGLSSIKGKIASAASAQNITKAVTYGTINAGLGQLRPMPDEVRMERVATDMAMGLFSPIGRVGYNVSGYAAVIVPALAISLFEGLNPVEGFTNASAMNILINTGTMAGMHALGHAGTAIRNSGGKVGGIMTAPQNGGAKEPVTYWTQTGEKTSKGTLPAKPAGVSYRGAIGTGTVTLAKKNATIAQIQAAEQKLAETWRAVSFREIGDDINSKKLTGKMIKQLFGDVPITDLQYKKTAKKAELNSQNVIIDKYLNWKAPQEGWSNDVLAAERGKLFSSGRSLYKGGLSVIARNKADIEDILSLLPRVKNDVRPNNPTATPQEKNIINFVKDRDTTPPTLDEINWTTFNHDPKSPLPVLLAVTGTNVQKPVPQAILLRFKKGLREGTIPNTPLASGEKAVTGYLNRTTYTDSKTGETSDWIQVWSNTGKDMEIVGSIPTQSKLMSGTNSFAKNALARANMPLDTPITPELMERLNLFRPNGNNTVMAAEMDKRNVSWLKVPLIFNPETHSATPKGDAASFFKIPFDQSSVWPDAISVARTKELMAGKGVSKKTSEQKLVEFKEIAAAKIAAKQAAPVEPVAETAPPVNPVEAPVTDATDIRARNAAETAQSVIDLDTFLNGKDIPMNKKTNKPVAPNAVKKVIEERAPVSKKEYPIAENMDIEQHSVKPRAEKETTVAPTKEPVTTQDDPTVLTPEPKGPDGGPIQPEEKIFSPSKWKGTDGTKKLEEDLGIKLKEDAMNLPKENGGNEDAAFEQFRNKVNEGYKNSGSKIEFKPGSKETANLKASFIQEAQKIPTRVAVFGTKRGETSIEYLDKRDVISPLEILTGHKPVKTTFTSSFEKSLEGKSKRQVFEMISAKAEKEGLVTFGSAGNKDSDYFHIEYNPALADGLPIHQGKDIFYKNVLKLAGIDETNATDAILNKRWKELLFNEVRPIKMASPIKEIVIDFGNLPDGIAINDGGNYFTKPVFEEIHVGGGYPEKLKNFTQNKNVINYKDAEGNLHIIKGESFPIDNNSPERAIIEGLIKKQIPDFKWEDYPRLAIISKENYKIGKNVLDKFPKDGGGLYAGEIPAEGIFAKWDSGDRAAGDNVKFSPYLGAKLPWSSELEAVTKNRLEAGLKKFTPAFNDVVNAKNSKDGLAALKKHETFFKAEFGEEAFGRTKKIIEANGWGDFIAMELDSMMGAAFRDNYLNGKTISSTYGKLRPDLGIYKDPTTGVRGPVPDKVALISKENWLKQGKPDYALIPRHPSTKASGVLPVKLEVAESHGMHDLGSSVMINQKHVKNDLQGDFDGDAVPVFFVSKEGVDGIDPKLFEIYDKRYEAYKGDEPKKLSPYDKTTSISLKGSQELGIKSSEGGEAISQISSIVRILQGVADNEGRIGKFPLKLPKDGAARAQALRDMGNDLDYYANAAVDSVKAKDLSDALQKYDSMVSLIAEKYFGVNVNKAADLKRFNSGLIKLQTVFKYSKDTPRSFSNMINDISAYHDTVGASRNKPSYQDIMARIVAENKDSLQIPDFNFSNYHTFNQVTGKKYRDFNTTAKFQTERQNKRLSGYKEATKDVPKAPISDPAVKDYISFVENQKKEAWDTSRSLTLKAAGDTYLKETLKEDIKAAEKIAKVASDNYYYEKVGEYTPEQKAGIVDWLIKSEDANFSRINPNYKNNPNVYQIRLTGVIADVPSLATPYFTADATISTLGLPKNIKVSPTTKPSFFDDTNKKIGEGSVIKWNGMKALIWKVNDAGKAQLISTAGAKLPGTPSLSSLKESLGKYKVISDGTKKIIVTDNDNIYSLTTGNKIIKNKENILAMAKKFLVNKKTE